MARQRSAEELRQILDGLEPYVEAMPEDYKQVIRGAGLNVVHILGALDSLQDQELRHSKQCAVLLYWARCLRREVPVI